MSLNCHLVERGRGSEAPQEGLPGLAVDEWYTPGWLFEDLAKRFGPFTLDVAASPQNAKCEEYFTESDDGRNQPWRGVVWCNPPYKNLIQWVEKAHRETCVEKRCERAVLLLPAQTSTRWFHDFALPYGRLHWIRGKVRFGGLKDRALMPSVAVIFDREAS